MSNQIKPGTHADGEVKRHPLVQYLLKYGIPLIISIGLCYLLFTGVDFKEMVAIIRSDCNFWWIALALALSILSHVIRAMRWRIQLRAIGVDARLWTVTLSIFGCYAVNLVLPRLGELWRTGYISQRQKAPFDKVFGSMVADRLSDTLTVIILTAATFIFASPSMKSYLQQNPESYMRIVRLLESPWLWCGIAAAIGAVVFLFRRFPNNGVVRKVREFASGLWKGFAAVGTMKGRGRWVLLTVLLWGCYFTQLFVAFFSFPGTAEVVARHGVQAVAVCFVLTSLSMGVPSNGGIGPWQWAMIFGLMIYSTGIPEMTHQYANSFANLVMGSQTLLLIALGLFTFVCIGLEKKHNHRNTIK